MSERNDTGPGHGGSHPFDDEFNSHRRDGEDHSAHSQGPEGNEDSLDRTGDSGNSTSDSEATGADEHEVLEGEIDDRDEWQRRFDDLVSDLDPPPDISYATSGVGPHAPPDPRDEPTLLEKWDQELPPDADEEEVYEPPPPPPIPWPSLPGLAGFFSVVAGILIFVRPEWLPFGTAGGRMVGFMVFVTGVALLISRLREEPEEDERPDDGAVVLYCWIRFDPRIQQFTREANSKVFWQGRRRRSLRCRRPSLQRAEPSKANEPTRTPPGGFCISLQVSV